MVEQRLLGTGYVFTRWKYKKASTLFLKDFNWMHKIGVNKNRGVATNSGLGGQVQIGTFFVS